MNYRHRFHAGNFADVMKHVLLVQLTRSLQQKERGILFLDTHAGRGLYDLASAAQGDALPRAPEWPDGIGRLWSLPENTPPVGDYLEVVRALNRQQHAPRGELQYYPGSPWIARALARPQDRIVFCERQPDELAALRAEFEFTPRCSVQLMDGYVALRSMLPPPERRGLILIDPPYEAPGEWAQILAGLTNALQRFPTGVYAIWYPLTERARLEVFLAGLVALQPPSTLLAELTVVGPGSTAKFPGCGLVIINPPWQFEQTAQSTLRFLAEKLGQEPGANDRWQWLVPA